MFSRRLSIRPHSRRRNALRAEPLRHGVSATSLTTWRARLAERQGCDDSTWPPLITTVMPRPLMREAHAGPVGSSAGDCRAPRRSCCPRAAAHRGKAIRHRPDLTHRFFIGGVGQVPCHCQPVTRCADVDAGRVAEHLVFSPETCRGGSRRTPRSPTNPGPRSETGLQTWHCEATRSRQYPRAAVPFLAHQHHRFFANAELIHGRGMM